MRLLIAFDKFKDSLSAPEACAIARDEIRRAHPDWEITCCPLADGGEGFAEILTTALGGEFRTARVQGPRPDLGDVEARYGLVKWDRIPAAARALLSAEDSQNVKGKLAVIEMASASGLALLRYEQRDPWLANTFGTGELLRAALGETRDVLLGIGGSATHDLGLGALAALGWRFLDKSNEAILPASPVNWHCVNSVVPGPSLPARIRVACDVTNPLLGPRGATACYARQKGLRAEESEKLESETYRIAQLLAAAAGREFDAAASAPGSGAAGGISYGLDLAFGAKRVPGFDLVSAWLDLPAKIDACDWVITGEGRFDATSLDGKGPGALIQSAVAAGKRVAVFAGSVDAKADVGGVRLHPIGDPALPLAENLARGGRHLAETLRRVFAAGGTT
jgi:glycerate 2-kinase